MRVPEGGQQRPLTRNGAPIVSCFARRGDSLRGVLPRMNRIMIENGIGIGHGLGMFAPFGDGGFFRGAFVPRFPCTFGAAVTWGYSRYGPSGAGWRAIVSGAGWRAIISGGRLACHYLSGPLGVPLSPGAAWRAIISRGRLACHCLRGRLAPNYLRGRLAPNYLRGRLAYSCQAPCQTWPKDCLIPTEKGSQIRDAPKETADPRSFSSQSVMVSIGRNRNLLSPFQRDRADFR
jgi:hypothetical protein